MIDTVEVQLVAQPLPRLRGDRLTGLIETGLISSIVLLSAALELVGLNGEAYGNTYYAAAVESMLANWHNFFMCPRT